MKSRKILQIVFSLLFLVALVVGIAGKGLFSSQKTLPEHAQHFNTEWAQNKLWEDGLAEVNQYKAERMVYGRPRKFTYTYVLVKETFNEEYNVKTDNYDRNDLFPVMKVNLFCRIPADNYPYHYLSSLFFRRENTAQLHKFTNSSQEWCGNTFKLFEARPNSGMRFTYHSYWDGQGDGSAQISSNVLFEDQLLYSLRSLKFSDGLAFEAPVYPSQISSKATIPKSQNATFTVFTDTLPQQGKAWKVILQYTGSESIRYWFGQEYPNKLLKMEAWDGRKMRLESSERYAYWMK